MQDFRYLGAVSYRKALSQPYLVAIGGCAMFLLSCCGIMMDRTPDDEKTFFKLFSKYESQSSDPDGRISKGAEERLDQSICELLPAGTGIKGWNASLYSVAQNGDPTFELSALVLTNAPSHSFYLDASAEELSPNIAETLSRLKLNDAVIISGEFRRGSDGCPILPIGITSSVTAEFKIADLKANDASFQ